MEKQLRFSVLDQNRVAKTIFDDLSDFAKTPEFVAVFHDECLKSVDANMGRRMFGANYIEGIALHHTVAGYLQAIAGDPQTPITRSRGLANLLLAFEIQISDMKYVLDHKIGHGTYDSQISLTGFARAVSHGNVDLADWWAKQIQVIYQLKSEDLRASMFLDTALFEHLYLLSKCWHDKRWASDSEIISSLGVYLPLWKNTASEDEMEAALVNAASFHLKQYDAPDLISPLGLPINAAYPQEILALHHLREIVFSTPRALPVHPIFDTAVANHQSPFPKYDDQWLAHIRSEASNFYGEHWSEYNGDWT